MLCEYRYELTERAVKDLDEIAGYLRDDLDNARAAMSLLYEVSKCVQRLCSFPASGSRILEEYLPEKNVRKVIVGNYILYYRVLKEQELVRMLRVVHGSRDQDAVLQNLNS